MGIFGIRFSAALGTDFFNVVCGGIVVVVVVVGVGNGTNFPICFIVVQSTENEKNNLDWRFIPQNVKTINFALRPTKMRN